MRAPSTLALLSQIGSHSTTVYDKYQTPHQTHGIPNAAIQEVYALQPRNRRSANVSITEKMASMTCPSHSVPSSPSLVRFQDVSLPEY